MGKPLFLILVVFTVGALMFGAFRKKLSLALKLILVVYAISALSRLRAESSDMSQLIEVALALTGVAALWGLVWLYTNWTLSRRQKKAVAGTDQRRSGPVSSTHKK